MKQRIDLIFCFDRIDFDDWKNKWQPTVFLKTK